MIFSSDQIVDWSNAIPIAIEAIDISDGTDVITGLNQTGLLISIRMHTSEFIRETQVLQDRFFIDGQCGLTEYHYQDQGDFSIENFMLVTSGDETLRRSQYRYDGKQVPRGQYNELPNNTIVISNPPREDIDNYISIWASYTMSMQACGIPKVVFDRYMKGIVAKSVAYSLKMSQSKGDTTRASITLINELEHEWDETLQRAKADANGLRGGGMALQPDNTIEGYLNDGGHMNRGFY